MVNHKAELAIHRTLFNSSLSLALSGLNIIHLWVGMVSFAGLCGNLSTVSTISVDVAMVLGFGGVACACDLSEH